LLNSKSVFLKRGPHHNTFLNHTGRNFMALHWELGKVKNYKELCYHYLENGDKMMKGKTESLLFLTMVVGMCEITQKNWREFYTRIFMLERTHGSYFYKDGKPDYYTPAEIQAHIGLGTNASNLTKTQFNKKIIEMLTNAADKKIIEMLANSAEKELRR
jgi:hypothetical protein